MLTSPLKTCVSILILVIACSCQVVELTQSDFDAGTYLLSEPGEYRLMENIVFNPNSVADLGTTSYEAGDVLPSQFTFAGGPYDPAAYGIGFFAAIAISADDAILDLNGFTISQAPEHALQQRFFAIIELADRPFIPNQGPHDFGQTPVGAAHNVVVKNGRLGLSSHHGIHGNLCTDITIEDLEIVDYEVAAIALNGVVGLDIKRVTTAGSREDVPIYGTFSSGRFIRPYINYLRDNNYDGTLNIGGVPHDINDIYNDLRDSLNNVFEDVIEDRNGGRNGEISENQHPAEYALYHNDHGVVDGNAYGILLNQPGVAVNGFPTIPDDPAAMVHLSDIEINNHSAKINEIPTLESTAGGPVIDPVGSVFQVFNRHPDDDEFFTISSSDFSDAEYVGNAVANAQAFVAKAAADNAFASSSLSISRLSIDADVLAWIEAEPNTSAAKLQNYIDEHGVFCNCDSMFHANKGVIGFKLDAANQVSVENVSVNNIRNMGELGETFCNYGPDDISNFESTLTGYQGATTRGFSVSGSVNIDIMNVKIDGVYSSSGSAYGIDIFLDSHDITIEDTEISEIHASTEHSSLSSYTGPNALPEAIGIRAEDSTSRVTTSNISSDDDFSNADFGYITLIQNASNQGVNYYSDSSNNNDDDDSRSNSGSNSNSNSGSSSSGASQIIIPVLFIMIAALI